MKELSEITINNNLTIRDAIKVIDKGALKIAFVINNSENIQEQFPMET